MLINVARYSDPRSHCDLIKIKAQITNLGKILSVIQALQHTKRDRNLAASRDLIVSSCRVQSKDGTPRYRESMRQKAPSSLVNRSFEIAPK